MAPRPAPKRSTMLRTTVLRRSATVVGEVRLYQELIRLAAEKVRLERELQMWEQKAPHLSVQLQAIGQYRKELLARLGLSSSRDGATPQPRSQRTAPPSGQGEHPTADLRYGANHAPERVGDR